jgi:cytochrome P450
MVTGYEEAVAGLSRHRHLLVVQLGERPVPGFPVPLSGDDVSALIEKHRDELPFNDQITTMDPPKHTAHRGLLMKLITPKRLKENEDFMWRLADRQIDEILGKGECEFIGQFAGPFTLLVIADLLGVPEADHASFRAQMGRGSLGSTGGHEMEHSRSSSSTALQ